MRTLVLLCLLGVAYAQYSAGFVKILEDKRYQDGSTFGNFRDQEDGIKYFEETDANGIRRGYWEYPSDNGQILRTEFESGPGIGFRITNSNHHDPTPIAKPQPQFQAAQPVQPPPAPAPAPVPVQTNTHHLQPATRVPVTAAPLPVVRALPTTTTPHPAFQNLFDYPANLEFSRSSGGHRFKFTAA